MYCDSLSFCLETEAQKQAALEVSEDFWLSGKDQKSF